MSRLKYLLCMIFGHIRFEQEWFSLTKTVDVFSGDVLGKDYNEGKRVFCSRCGVKLA